RKIDAHEEVAAIHMGIVERLAWPKNRSCRHACTFEGRNRFGAGPLADPLLHALADELAMIAASLVGGKALVFEPLGCADQFRDAAKERMTVYRDDDPTVLGLIDVARPCRLAAVQRRLALEVERGFLEKRRREEGERGAQQGAFDQLAAPRRLAHPERRRNAQRKQGGRTE